MDQMNKLRQIATAYDGVPSAKLDYIMAELEENPDDQFVVFTWYKRPGRILAERLGDQAVVHDGDASRRDRATALQRHEAGSARVLIGSIATIGESLNLQYCHEAFRLDRSWNPGANDQTRDRLYRNGQQSRVTFRDLWAKDTVDLLRVQPNLWSKESMRMALYGQS
jgi:SNF2 family DNA or RNA helicase